MKKFYIASQAPIAEVEVKSEKDAEGKSQSITVGFKRYTLSKAQEKIKSFETLSEEQGLALLKSEIVFLKNVLIDIYDEDTAEVIETLKISDTRKAEPVDPFWGDKEECLKVLVEHYLDSSPWKGSFVQAYIKTLYNIDFKEAEAKN